MYIKVRLLFDPPATSFAISSLKENAAELEARLLIQREADLWISQTPNT